GDLREIAYDGAQARLRDSRGLQYIACLLANVDRELHVLDLVALAAGGMPELGKPSRMSAGPAMPPLDPRAKEEYRRRLQELHQDLEDAECRNDRGTAEQLRAEIEVIGDELARAVGLGGRDRPVGAGAERARVAVTKRIKDALARIQPVHPSLAEHLRACVTTGHFCAYRPARPTLPWEC